MDAGVLLKNISDAVETAANTELAPFGLTVSQYRYLEYLQQFPSGVAAKELGAYFKVSQPTVAGVLKRLKAKGYIRAETSPEDERAKIVSITPEGRGVTAQAALHKANTEELILHTLSPAERETVKTLLGKIWAGIYSEEKGGGQP